MYLCCVPKRIESCTIQLQHTKSNARINTGIEWIMYCFPDGKKSTSLLSVGVFERNKTGLDSSGVEWFFSCTIQHQSDAFVANNYLAYEWINLEKRCMKFKSLHLIQPF